MAVLFTVFFVAYLGISAVAVEQLSKPIRKPVTGTPADYGLAYERVRFNSAADNIPLEGWYIDSPGAKVLLIFHGRNGVRNDTDGKLLRIAQAFAQRNYDVLMFDFRGHGESGGDRYSFGQWEVRDAAAGTPNVQVWIVPGAEHEHTSAFDLYPQEYLKRVIGFFDQNLK